jgi:phenylalanyl-tRNA synthetase beta chain
MCHVGLAREAAAVHGTALVLPAPRLPERRPAAPGELVAITDPERCRRYVGIVVRGVRVAPSPEWLQRRLRSLGLRPINNVVDVTNLVLWESGQPLHAFDLATLAGGRVVVREAAEGETLRTLDGEARKLQPGMLLIADAVRPVGLAGVMGGQETEVTPGTTEVLLESAWFDPRSVRRTARLLGMHTDASHRFERGVDPAGQLAAAERAASLLVELAGAREVATAADVRGEALAEPPPIALSGARLDRFVGQSIPPSEVERLLAGVGFEAVAAGPAEWRVSVPSWRRFDVLEEADLFEEVLRLHGFDRVAPALPAVSGPDAPEPPAHRLRRRVRQVLSAAGLAEAVDWSFYAAEDDARFAPAAAPGPALRLLNPLSERYALMRRSLLPGLLEAATFNRRRDLSAVRLFEIGHVFWRAADGRPAEADHLGAVLGGRLGNPWQGESELGLFDLAGILEELAEVLGRRLEAEPAELPGFEPGRAARLRLPGGEVVGALGQVTEPAEAYPLFAAELTLEAFLPLPSARAATLPSRFPAIAADLTLTHAATVSWAALVGEIERLRPAELVRFDLENRYQGEGVPAGAVNTTVHFVYQAADRSLTQEEVNERQGSLAAALEERFGWRGAGGGCQ